MEYSWGTRWGRSVFGMPETVAVACPRCAKEVSFQPPFDFLDETATGAEHLLRWNNCGVRESFPTVFPWEDKDNPFRGLFWGTPKRHASEYPIWGVVTCPHCTLLRKHRLEWPKEAYYAVAVDSQVLWAWDRHTLVEVRDHVASTIRAKRAHPLLKYMPRHFLVAKRRAAVVKAINLKLNGNDA